jgi:hypothetical protein
MSQQISTKCLDLLQAAGLVVVVATLLLGMADSRTSADDHVPAKATASGLTVTDPGPIERLLSAKTVFLLLDEGFDAHRRGWEATAANDSLSKTGVFQIGQDLLESYLRAGQAQTRPQSRSVEDSNAVTAATRLLSQKGFAIAVSVSDGPEIQWPHLTIILSHGGDLVKILNAPPLTSLETQADSASPAASDTDPEQSQTKKLPLENKNSNVKPIPQEKVKHRENVAADSVSWKSHQIGDREFHVGKWMPAGFDAPGIGFVFWNEKGHFVYLLGPNALQEALKRMDGKTPNITSNRIWQELHGEQLPFERRSYGWIDLQGLRSAYGDISLGGTDTFFRSSIELLELGIDNAFEDPFELIMTWPFMALSVFSQQPEATLADAIEFRLEVADEDATHDALITSAEHIELDQQLQNGLIVQIAEATPEIQIKVAGSGKQDSPLLAQAKAAVEVAVEPSRVQDGPVGVADANPRPKTETQQLPDDGEFPPIQFAENQLTVGQFVTAIGLENAQYYTWQSGYRGRALWSETFLSIPGPKQGLLAISDQPAMKLDQLPPLPVDVSTFSVFSLDLPHSGQALKQIFARFKPMLSEMYVKSAEEFFEMISIEVGPSFGSFVGALDPIVCVYNDATNGPLSIGPVLVCKVHDAAKIRGALNKFVAFLTEPGIGTIMVHAEQKPAGDSEEEDEGDVVPRKKADRVEKQIVVPSSFPKVTRKIRYGREVVGVQCSGIPFGFSYVIDEKWLAISLNSQLLDAFLLRLDGKLPHWEPTAVHREALSLMPETFTSISIEDPRKTLPNLVSLAYCSVGWLDVLIDTSEPPPELRGFLGRAASLPPAELIVQPLFPNVSTTSVDADGIRTRSRISLPALTWWNYAIVFGASGFSGLLNQWNF